MNPPVERRAAPRLPARLPSSCRLYLHGGGPAGQADVLDLSEDGIGLKPDHPLTPGTPLVVRLPGVVPGRTLYLAARVVHAGARPDGSWRAGCRFNRRFRPEWLGYLGP